MALDLSADWQLIDDPVSVAYYSKTGEGQYTPPAAGTPVTVTHAQVSQVTQADVKTDPALLENDTCVFHLWRAKLGTITPKLGDLIKDADGATWIVHSVQPSDRDGNGYQRYRLITIARNN